MLPSLRTAHLRGASQIIRLLDTPVVVMLIRLHFAAIAIAGCQAGAPQGLRCATAVSGKHSFFQL
jgi:hypothetical protein